MTENQETPRHLVVQSDSRPLAERSAASLIARGTELAVQLREEVHARDKAGRTPLHHAARDGDVQRALFLLRNGAHVNAQSALGWTPLHIAVQFGKTQLARLLLEHGAHINTASFLVNFGTVEWSKGSDRNFIIRKSLPDNIQEDMTQSRFLFPICGVGGGRFPIHDAKTGDAAVLLNEFGADVRARDYNARTPLHDVLNLEIAQVLIAHGADVNARDVDGLTPLHNVLDAEIAQVLIDHGADVNARTEEGCTPLHDVLDAATAQVLVAHGADVNAPDLLGQTPLHRQASEGAIALVAVLLGNGAEVDCFDKEGYTPFAYALNDGALRGSVPDADYEGTADLLRAYGAKVLRRLI